MENIQRRDNSGYMFYILGVTSFEKWRTTIFKFKIL